MSEHNIQSIQIEMSMERLIQEMENWDIDKPRICHDISEDTDGVSIFLYDKFIMLRKLDHGNYRAIAIGINDKEENFLDGHLTLINYSAIEDAELVTRSLEAFNGMLNSNSTTIPTHQKVDEISTDNLIELIEETWTQFRELKDAVIH